MIEISQPVFGPDVEAAVLEVLRSGRISMGPVTEAFEQDFAEAVGVEHAVAVSNGTVALIAALQALGIGPGDEVVTSAVSFVASVNSILAVGATPRFADVDPATLLVTAESLAAGITPRTAAVMPVHLYGQMANMPEIMRLAASHGLAVVEDSAQAHGARFAGRSSGSYGIGCFSLYATKNVATGEGGMVTTSDADLAGRLRLLRNQGMRSRYEYESIGYNYRITDLQAAIGRVELSKLSARNHQRRANAAVLTRDLDGLDGLTPPAVADEALHVFHQYTVDVGGQTRISRDDVVLALAQRGVTAVPYYPKPVFDYACFSDFPWRSLCDTPTATALTRTILSLPVHPHLSSADLTTVVAAVRAALC